MYLLTLPENRLERKGRMAGWTHLHLERQAKQDVHNLCQQLKDKGITCAISSDLDVDALHIVGSELHTDKFNDFSYRRFNIGRNHGAKAGHVQMILEQLIGKWKDNDAIPIRGGDSWKSVERRLLASVSKLLDRPGPLVFITDAQTATLVVYGKPEALLINGTGLKPARIYKVEKPHDATPR
jgi:broad specificity phosphatase PhoE